MGLISNICVFSLMILPLVLMSRGHRIEYRRAISLLALVAVCLIAEESLRAALFPIASALLLPVLETAVSRFVLCDAKARRVLRVSDAGDEAAAVFATVWSVADVSLNRWFRWYRVMGGAGFDADSLIAGAETFAAFGAALLAARCVAAGNASDAVKVAVLRGVAGVGGAVCGVPIAGTTAAAVLLAAMHYTRPVEKGEPARKEE